MFQRERTAGKKVKQIKSEIRGTPLLRNKKISDTFNIGFDSYVSTVRAGFIA